MQRRHAATLGLLALALAAAAMVRAQSTSGFHRSIVFPVVVHSGSFTQRFDLANATDETIFVGGVFAPGSADGLAGEPSDCPARVIFSHATLTLASLPEFCPGISGSTFGYLRMDAFREADGTERDVPLFSAFSRVSNPAGAGFDVEGFPAETFSQGTTLVTGLRRAAATATTPAYQTNCFVGAAPQSAVPPIVDDVAVTVRAKGQQWSALVRPAANHVARLLDVFAAVGVPPGDVTDATVEFASVNTDPARRAGLVTFCTVQENSHFSADFRIGKVVAGALGLASSDGLAARKLARDSDIAGRPFALAAGASANTHLVYFRHPDLVKCRLLDHVGGVPVSAAAGMELRMRDSQGAVLAGGTGMTTTGNVYLGDIGKQAGGGYNTRYRIEVESNGQNAGAVRPYALECQSGSGHSFGYDLIEYQAPVDRF